MQKVIGQETGGMGNYVIIDYGSGITVRAMHMYNGTIKVKNGDKVESGQILGKIGHSGDSTGPHLHIDMTLNGTWVDISQYIANPGEVTNNSFSGETTTSVKMAENIIKRENNKGYKINIDLDEEIDNMLAKLRKLGFNMESYLSTSKQKEYLKNMIRACIVTQYPDLRSADQIKNNVEIPSDETQGCIRIKRYTDNETEVFSNNSLRNPTDDEKNGGGMYLEYMPLDDLNEMISNGDTKALNYFSMDSSNNIVVAGWETMDVTVNIEQTNVDEVGVCPVDIYGEVEYNPKAENYEKLTIKKINYLNQVSNYMIPFSLFWSLLVYGHDEKFINDFANLVIDTDIVIGCYDVTKTTTTKYTDTQTKKGVAEINNYRVIDESERGRDNGKVGETIYKEISYNFLITETDILKTDNPTLKVKYADTWTAVYNNDYKMETKEKEEKGEKVEYEDDNEYEGSYQKVVREDGTVGYTNNNRPSDEKLADMVENAINESFENNVNLFKQEAENKNRGLQYRYTILTEFLEENSLYNESAININATNQELKDYLNKKEVQDYLINFIINIADNEYIDTIFNNTESEDYKMLLIYANDINSNNAKGIVESAGTTAKTILQKYVREKGGTDSDLYNLLTKNGTETKLCYTTASMQSSQIGVTIKTTNKTEEYEKNIIEEEIIEVPNQDGNIRWKDDKNAQENSFVKLLAYSRSAKGNLQIISAWFFDSVEDTAAIADMEDLLKFLFQKVYNKNYGIKPEDADKLLKEFFDPSQSRNMQRVSSTVLTGNGIEEQVWNFFASQGFSDQSTAAILSNLYCESMLDPTLDIAPCGGIACFEKSTGCFSEMQHYASSKGKDWTDLQCQLEFLITQLPSTFDAYTGVSPYYYDTGEWCWWPESMTIDDFKNLSDTQKAAEIFCRVYERPSITHIDRRKSYAQEYYDKYHK